jgi:transglutaminase-like putative cysteine protease
VRNKEKEKFARSNFYSATFLLLSLVLLTQVYFMKSKDRWQETGVTIDSDTEFSLGRGALILGLVLVLLAWNIPTVVLAFDPDTIHQRSLSQTWQEFRQRFENATASLKGPLSIEQETFGDQLGLGTGSPLSDELVLSVEPALNGQTYSAPFYWRGRSYDFYDSKAGWRNTRYTEEEAPANGAPFQNPPWTSRLEVKFTIHTDKNLGVYYAPSIPVSISRPSKVVASNVADNEIDLVGLVASPPIRGGETYEVTSLLSAPTIVEMRASPQTYPQWVKDKYLQLPEDMPTRISDLADEITAGLENPYDKAAAVTEYLRREMTYAPVVEAPPAGQDAIDYFLFDSKTGFCNYYATAEILLLRSVGVPARLAAGYAQGSFNSDAQAYEVRRKQSHAWPEIYFEGLGWVEFEPTASQPDIARLPGDDPNNPEVTPTFDPNVAGNDVNRPNRDVEDIPTPQDQNPAGPRPFPWALLVFGAVVLAAAVATVWYLLKRKANQIEPLPVLIETRLRQRGWSTPRWVRRWAHISQLSPVERVFLTVEWVSALLGKPVEPSATPSEAILALDQLLPDGVEYTGVLLHEYQRAIYSPYPADLEKARTASRQLWKAGLNRWLHRLLDGRRAEEVPY